MRVLFLGKSKPCAIAAFEWLLSRGVEVGALVAPAAGPGPEPSLAGRAVGHGIPVIPDRALYRALAGESSDARLRAALDGVDLVVSFLFWKRIQPPLLRLPRLGAINFHPAPLPDFRGVCGYSFAIYEGVRRWGVSAHFVDESFDTGDLIRVRHFPIEPERETARSLEQKTAVELLALFQEVVDLALSGAPLPRTPQTGGRYTSYEDFEALRRIAPEDDAETIERKIRACWSPPHAGACVVIDGKEYTLVSDDLLRRLAAEAREGGGT